MCKNIIETSSSSATDWHPFGMLDRDQRTIFTFSPIKLAKNDQPLKNFVNKTTKQGQLNKCIACDTMTTTATATDHLCDKKICCTINTNTNDNTKIGTKFIHRNTNTRSHQMHCCHNSNGVGQQRQHQCCRTAAQRQTIKYLRTKFSDYILICFCIWFLSVQQTTALPTGLFKMQQRSLESKLEFPCGVNYITPEEDVSPIELKALFNVIYTQTKIAWDQADKDIKNYLETTWGIQLAEFHQLWKHKKQDWLYPSGKELNKQMAEDLSNDVPDYFKTSAQTLNREILVKLLVDCDDRLQRLIIGFSAIIDDHQARAMKMDKQKYDELLKIFQSASKHMTQVLCEVRTTSQKLGVDPIINSPSVMSDKSKTDNFRDWIIFREYVNQLEYMRDVFGIVHSNILV